MPRKKSSLLHELSTADLKLLLAARERIDVLEVEKARLVKELGKVEKELGRLMSGTAGTGRKALKKAAVKRAPGKKPAKKKTPPKRKTPTAGKMKLEDVIVAVIRKKRGPVAYQDLKTRIVKGKLFKTKSGNFDNVLRRTLSTSKAVKRVARGVYDIA